MHLFQRYFCLSSSQISQSITMSDILNPRPFLKSLLDKKVVVSLKWGNKYFGKLTQVDKYMNLALEDVAEIRNGKRSNTTMKTVLVRCNNILYIQECTKEIEEQECVKETEAQECVKEMEEQECVKEMEEQECNSGEGTHVTEM
ncbi:hypothetical protein CEXT_301131 [Caerostris extrusa]|uniref:Sm domain-containing protein n=1 Tax=Caerostris extrusa TaxID=172846 RepID=A0AAV4XVA2_CAEEX|nr:hypothetical protein CEXT_301131 [Caerostris extrusa]